jgi:hypothetical protein
MFSITTVNGKGIIRLIGQLDYERKFLYQLRVMAVDRANNERVSNGTIIHGTKREKRFKGRWAGSSTLKLY